MALSFKTVQKAYKVFKIIKESGFIPSLQIPKFPEEMSNWEQNKKAIPNEATVYGWEKKGDEGWDILFRKQPSL
jgi:hypothetical protein